MNSKLTIEGAYAGNMPVADVSVQAFCLNGVEICAHQNFCNLIQHRLQTFGSKQGKYSEHNKNLLDAHVDPCPLKVRKNFAQILRIADPLQIVFIRAIEKAQRKTLGHTILRTTWSLFDIQQLENYLKD